MSDFGLGEQGGTGVLVFSAHVLEMSFVNSRVVWDRFLSGDDGLLGDA